MDPLPSVMWMEAGEQADLRELQKPDQTHRNFLWGSLCHGRGIFSVTNLSLPKDGQASLTDSLDLQEAAPAEDTAVLSLTASSSLTKAGRPGAFHMVQQVGAQQ